MLWLFTGNYDCAELLCPSQHLLNGILKFFLHHSSLKKALYTSSGWAWRIASRFVFFREEEFVKHNLDFSLRLLPLAWNNRRAKTRKSHRVKLFSSAPGLKKSFSSLTIVFFNLPSSSDFHFNHITFLQPLLFHNGSSYFLPVPFNSRKTSGTNSAANNIPGEDQLRMMQVPDDFSECPSISPILPGEPLHSPNISFPRL